MEVHAADTRTLSPKAKLLYAGVKQTRDGFEIKMRDQDKAMENVAKHLGMFVEKHEHTGADGGPIVVKLPEELGD
jgi:phage terminase small subunit